MTILDILLVVVSALVLVPISVFVAECFAALLPTRRREIRSTVSSRAAILVPAHNEEKCIAQTVAALAAQVRPADRIVVIADNCTDATADQARSAGATVVERFDEQRRGKGYALDRGVRYLEADPPEVVIVVDADCMLAPGSVDVLARTAAATGRPAQAVNLINPPQAASAKARISALAFLVKNLVRPIGLMRLGLPCMITGTGFCMPWQVIREAPLASGNIVEDMQMGLNLTMQGLLPLYCPEARVTSDLPSTESASVSQRTRWEHGHLQTLLTQAPRLVGKAVSTGRVRLLGVALDLSVPPLSLLVMLWGATSALTCLAWALGASPLPAVLMLAGGVGLLSAVIAGWARFGRQICPFNTLLAVPMYVVWKLPVYLAFLLRRQKAWVRTEREAETIGQVRS